MEGSFHLHWPLVPLYIVPPPSVDERRVLHLPEQEDRLCSLPLSSSGRPSLKCCVDGGTEKMLESVMGPFNPMYKPKRMWETRKLFCCTRNAP